MNSFDQLLKQQQLHSIMANDMGFGTREIQVLVLSVIYHVCGHGQII